jgi:hypothetical protein
LLHGAIHSSQHNSREDVKTGLGESSTEAKMANSRDILLETPYGKIINYLLAFLEQIVSDKSGSERSYI